MELVLIGLIAGIGFASYTLWSRARGAALPEAAKPASRALPPAERTAANLEVADVVQHMGDDWVVEGILNLAEDGRNTRLYAVTDGSQLRYLFSSTAEPEPVLLRAAPELNIENMPDILNTDGQRFGLALRGSVAAKRTGTIFPEQKGDNRITFVAYTAGAARLLLLRWGNRIDAFLGERIPSHQLEYLPGA